MNKIIKWVIAVLLVVTLLGCSKQSNTNVSELETRFSTAVPLTGINKSLRIVVDSKEPTINAWSTIGVTVYNKSSHSIHFDNNSSVKLMGSTDKVQWFPVKNAITYSDNMSLSPQGTPLLDLNYTWMRPVLDSTNLDPENTNVLLRIVLVGEIMENDIPTGEEVAAYLDVVLKP